jgi:hypothetical protein
MYSGKGGGLAKWPGIARKVLCLLRHSKDRLLQKLLAAFIPEETTDSELSSGKVLFLSRLTSLHAHC